MMGPVQLELLPVPAAMPSEGGGATTLGLSEESTWLPLPCALAFAVTVGGGGTTLLESDGDAPLAGFELTEGGGGTTLAASVGEDVPLTPFELTAGGGGTTSLVPKILPIKLLMNDPLAGCEGGGGTTAFPGSTFPPASSRVSCDKSADGGGATTDGGGRVSELRCVACSGAETGGGTTAALVISTGAPETSRATAAGDGGITLPDKTGAVRFRSRETLGAGATICASRVGAVRA